MANKADWLTEKTMNVGGVLRTVMILNYEESDKESYFFEFLKSRGDIMVIQLAESKEASNSLRAACSQWCKRYGLKIKVNELMPSRFRLELVEGQLGQPRNSGPRIEKYPELGTMEVGDFFDYDYQHPPYRGSHMPIGLVAAMYREKRKGKEFEYTNASTAICRVIRIK